MLIRATLAALCGLAVLVTSASAFEGRYSANASGVRRTAVITKTGDNVYKVVVTVAYRSCSGDVEAIGEVKRGALVAEVKEQDDPCKLTITRRGAGISVAEDSCLNWHGASCGFDGQLQPR